MTAYSPINQLATNGLYLLKLQAKVKYLIFYW